MPVAKFLPCVLIRSCIAAWFFAFLVCAPLGHHVFAAGTLVNSQGFESPTYNTGSLQGQQSWNVTGTGPASTAAVQAGIGISGGRGVRIDRAANSDYYWAVPLSGSPTQRFVYIDWDMKVAQTISEGFGPFLGVQAYDYVGTQLYLDYGVLAALGVDGSTGDVLYQQAGSGELAESSFDVVFDQWSHFRILIDFVQKKYYGYFGSNLVVASNFVDGLGLTDFTDADLAAFAAGADDASQEALGTTYIDNFIVVEPTPGDYDADGDVDAADYTRWKSTFGTVVSPAGSLADGNGNGVVDAADYTVWRDHRAGIGAASSQAIGGAAAPEPSSVALLCFAWVLVGIVRRSCWQRRSFQ